MPGQLLLAIAITTGAKMAQENLGLAQWQMLGLVAGMFFVQWVLIRTINLGRHWMHWTPAVIVVAGYILTNWPGPGNHTYVYLYLCLIFLVIFLNRPQHHESLLIANTRNLFMVIMLMAVVQKILTPGYLDGTVNAFWLANGGYFKPLYFFSENWQEVVESNHALLNDYYNETLYRTDNIVLQSPVGNLQLWGFLCTLLILGGEILYRSCLFLNALNL